MTNSEKLTVTSKLTENVIGVGGFAAILSILCMVPWTGQGWYFPVTDAGIVVLTFLFVLFIPRRSKLIASFDSFRRFSLGTMAFSLSFVIFLGLLLFGMGYFAVEASLPNRHIFAKVANNLFQNVLTMFCFAYFASRKRSQPVENGR